MNYSRTMGMLWGIQIGFCLAAGLLMNPVMFLVAIIPVTGILVFRSVT